MSLRLIHSADLHLDAPLRSLSKLDPGLRGRVAGASREALRRIAARCLEVGAEALLLAGDVFDGAVQTVEAAAVFATRIAELEAAGVRVFMIRGNHDHANAAFDRFAMPANLHVFGSKGGSTEFEARDGTRVVVHGVSYDSREAPAAALDRYAAPTPGALNVGLLHTSLTGAAAHDRYAPCAPGDLAAIGYDYWALGHVHGRAVHAREPWIVMPGCPQARHVNEPGPRSATEIVVEGGRIAEVAEFPTSSVVFERIEVAAEGGEDVRRGGVEDVVRACRGALEARAAGLGDDDVMIARVRLTGAAETLRRLRADLDFLRERLAEEAPGDGRAHVERLELAEAGSSAAPAGASSGASEAGAAGEAVAEIAGRMTALAREPAMRTALMEILDQGRDRLPREVRARWPVEEAALAERLDALTAEAVEEVLAAFETAPDTGAERP